MEGGCLGTPQPAGAVKGQDQERQLRERCESTGSLARQHPAARGSRPTVSTRPTRTRHRTYSRGKEGRVAFGRRS